MAAVRIGILGGTFDPVHMGHLVLAEQALEQLVLQRVLWVVAGEPWRKSGQAISPAGHRLAMVELAIEGRTEFKASTVEIDRPGPSYTIETLEELHRRHAKCELMVILGLDALLDLPNWREPERIVQLAMVAAAARGDKRPSAAKLDRLLPGLAARTVWLDMPRLDISATDLRERARHGRSLRYLVPDAVAAYIAEHRLYQGS